MYGGGDNPSEQSSALCSGSCPDGMYCPTVPTITPIPTPPGTYAREGATQPEECGSSAVYCPGGGVAALPVPAGFVAVGGTLTTRNALTPCPLGHYCFGGAAIACAFGTYTDANYTQRTSVPIAPRSTMNTWFSGEPDVNRCRHSTHCSDICTVESVRSACRRSARLG